MFTDEGGLWELYMTFPSTYPHKPPDVRFVNRIHHCNINSQGKVCHSILDRNWNPARSARDVIDCIYGLLLTPEPDDPLDSTIAEEYYADKAVFEQNARDLVKSCASESKAGMERRMARESPDEVTPTHLTCPLTKQLMEEPVLLTANVLLKDGKVIKSGTCFERAAITTLLKNGAAQDLFSLAKADGVLVENGAIATAIQEWKDAANQTTKQWWD